jgi:starch synthase
LESINVWCTWTPDSLHLGAVNTLNILMVVSEAVPFSKTGGLGDVGGALPAALARLGHDVTAVVPRYRGGPDGRVVASFEQGAWPGAPEVRVLEPQAVDGVRLRLVDCPPYYDRAEVYGTSAGDYPDNDRRYALLSRVALETAVRLRERPAVLHAHDWQTGLAPAYLATRFADHPSLGGTAAVFTIHNLAYQGLFARDVLPTLDLGWDTFTSDGLEFWKQVSFLKAGISYAQMVTTVSRRYAVEIQTAEQGFGFEGVLHQRSDVLVGIPNGIDPVLWDPAADPYLPASFTADNLAGKAAVKHALLERFGMSGEAAGRRPVIGMVSRMVDQKGLDIIARAAGDLMALGATFVILGTGAPKYERMWRQLAAQHPDRVAVTVGFSEELAHLIEGGADIFLMPSHFEPCGLNQLYSLRYGTVPVVRATGGLDDTVRQVQPRTGEGTGFKFSPYTPAALLAALREALAWYRRPEAWQRIQQAGMREDHSWDASAREYVGVYEQARRIKAG